MFEYEVRVGTAPKGVRLATHHRFISATIWANLSLQARAEMFDELEAEFRAWLAVAPTPEIQIGANSWRVDHEVSGMTDQLRLEVSGPVYVPPKASPSFETRPIPTPESAGAATRALIMAANELAVAVRVMIGDRELHVLHRPVRKLEQALAAWPHPPTQEQEAAPTTEPADQLSRTAHLAKLDQLLAKAIQDATRPMGDHQAAEIAVRLLEHQAALLGLYPLGDS